MVALCANLVRSTARFTLSVDLGDGGQPRILSFEDGDSRRDVVERFVAANPSARTQRLELTRAVHNAMLDARLVPEHELFMVVRDELGNVVHRLPVHFYRGDDASEAVRRATSGAQGLTLPREDLVSYVESWLVEKRALPALTVPLEAPGAPPASVEVFAGDGAGDIASRVQAQLTSMGLDAAEPAVAALLTSQALSRAQGAGVLPVLFSLTVDGLGADSNGVRWYPGDSVESVLGRARWALGLSDAGAAELAGPLREAAVARGLAPEAMGRVTVDPGDGSGADVLDVPVLSGEGFLDAVERAVRGAVPGLVRRLLGTRQVGQAGLLRGCSHVFLDLGSNIGVQVRKMYEPEKYPGSLWGQRFESAFGGARGSKRGLCAVGFEPNPGHTGMLERLEAHYQTCGWRAHFFTETAVTAENGSVDLYIDDGPQAWAASVIEGHAEAVGVSARVDAAVPARLHYSSRAAS